MHSHLLSRQLSAIVPAELKLDEMTNLQCLQSGVVVGQQSRDAHH